MHDGDDALTPREEQVLALMSRHLTNGDIARELGVSFETVKSHVSHILAKLGVDSRDDAVLAWSHAPKPRSRVVGLAMAVLHLRLMHQIALALVSVAAVGGIGIGIAFAAGALPLGGGRSSMLADRYAADIQAYRTAHLSYVSWATGFDTIASAAAGSDTIVIGRPATSTQVSKPVGEVGVGGEDPETTFSVEVQRTLKGTAKAGASIPVAQTGGVQSDGQITMIEGSPLLSSDMTYLLFLRYDPESKTYALQGPGARFVVTGGRIDSLSSIYGHHQFFDMGISNMPLAEAIAQIRVSAPPRNS